MSSIPETPNPGSRSGFAHTSFVPAISPRIKARTTAVFPVAIHPCVILQATCITISKRAPLMTIRHIPPPHSSILRHPLPRLRGAPSVRTRLRPSPRNSSRVFNRHLHMRPLPHTHPPHTAYLPPMPNSGNKNLGRLNNTHSLLLLSQCKRR